jgi:outer membrane receptor for ferrienterochelin and colicins
MKRSQVVPFAIAACCLAAASARAEDTSDLQSILEEHVITTASTTAQTESAAPAVSTTITGDALARYGVRTIAEAVNFLSMGVVTGDPLRTPDIGARGVLFENDDGKHFLLLINGHAVNDPLYGAARFDQGAGVPIDMVDHIEVVVGPGSVLYGSNAMMGVINVITKDASAYKGGHALSEYEPGRSFRAAAGTGFTFKLFGAPSEITAGVDYYRRFGPDLDFGYQDFSGGLRALRFSYTFGKNEPGPNIWGGTVERSYFADVPSGMLRFRSGDFEVNVLASAYRRGIPYATAASPVAFDDDRSQELDRTLRLDVKHNATLSQLVQLSSRLYADGMDFQRRANLPGTSCLLPAAYCQYYDAGRSRWLGVEERVSLNWLHDQSLVTLIGVDARQRWVSAKQDALDADTHAYIGPTTGHIDESSLLVSPYLQQTYSPTGWLDLNGGARLDKDNRFDAVLSPRGAVAVRPWKKTTFKVSYSQAFRAPSWSETAFANHVLAPNDGIKSERVHSVEGSIEQRFGTQRLLFGVFGTRWNNLIEPTPLTPERRTQLETEGRIQILVGTSLLQYRNVDSIDNYGWNGAFEGSLVEGRLRYGANLTGAITRPSDSNTDEPASPQFFGNARISYAAGGLVPTPALAASLIGRRAADRTIPNSSTLLPSAPTTLDLRLTFTGRVPGLRGVSYRLSGEYISASRGPYHAGPTILAAAVSDAALQPGSSLVPRPEAIPVDQYRAFFGLRYDFGTGTETNATEVP